MPSTSSRLAVLAAAALGSLFPLALGCELLRSLDDLTGGGHAPPPGLDAAEAPDIPLPEAGETEEAPAPDGAPLCNLDCLGGACDGGVCQPFEILDGLHRPFDVAIDDGGVVYWSELDTASAATGTIWELQPRTGFPAVKRALVNSDSPPRWLFLYGGDVYWTGTTPHGVVGRCPVVGGGCRFNLPDGINPPTSVIAYDVDPVHVNVPDSIVADPSGIYWTNRGHAGQDDGSIVVCASGKCPFKLVELAINQDSPQGLAVDQDFVYWANEGDPTLANGAILAIHKSANAGVDGGEVPLVLASGLASPAYLALDATHVYFTTQGGTNADGGSVDGQILMIPKTGLAVGQTPTLVAAGQSGAYAIALDPSGIYWTTAVPEGLVGWSPIGIFDAGATLAGSQPNPQGIALDLQSVYFTTYAEPGAIWRVAKRP